MARDGYAPIPSNTPTTRALVLHPGRSPGYSYSYGPQGLKGILANRYTASCAILASIGGVAFGYDQGVIANVLVMPTFQKQFPLNPIWVGIMTAVLELGALFGALAAGVIADRTSRTRAMMFSSMIFSLGSAFQCAASSTSFLILGRAIGGFGVGALSMLSPLYISELAPPELRGSLVALEQFAIVLGVVLGFWIGFLTRAVPSSLSWRIPLALQLVPGLVLGLGSGILPQSPRLLVLRGRIDEARAVLHRIRGTGTQRGDDDESVELLENLIELELMEMRIGTTLAARQEALDVSSAEAIHGPMPATQKGGSWGAWAALLGPKYRDRTLIGVAVMFFQQWSGINAFLYYGPSLLREIGLGGQGAINQISRSIAGLEPEVGIDTPTLVVAGGIGIVQFLAVLPVILGLDHWGRKPLLRGGALVMGMAHLLIALLVHEFEGQWGLYPSTAWIAVLAVYVFTAAYGVSFGPIGWVLPSEVLPSSVRSRGVALATASNWLNNFLIGLVTPAMMAISPAGTFGVFSVACFGAYLWVTNAVPETANVSLEEIDALFASAAAHEEGSLRAQIEGELGLPDLIARLTNHAD